MFRIIRGVFGAIGSLCCGKTLTLRQSLPLRVQLSSNIGLIDFVQSLLDGIKLRRCFRKWENFFDSMSVLCGEVF